MKHALVIGGTGFVGRYLIDEIRLNTDWAISSTVSGHKPTASTPYPTYKLDILSVGEISDLLQTLKPDFIFHLAAQSSVGLSWKNPDLTIDTNIKGSLNILEAVKNCSWRPRLLLVGSGEEYGTLLPDELPIKESTRTHPNSVYALTKLCQNYLGDMYAKAYDMDIVMARPFNHIGPGQNDTFVVSDFCKQVAEIEENLCQPILRVGNLTAKRDFTDVRDVVRAYTLLIQFGQKGESYNIGSGNSISIHDVLQKLLSISAAKISVIKDSAKFRPVDTPIVQVDISKITETCGWLPSISLETSLSDTLSYWRKIVKPS